MLGIYLQDYTNFTAALKGRYYHHLFRDENKHKDAQRVLRFQNPLIHLENIYKTPTVYLFTRYLNFWHRPFVAWLPPGLHGLFPRRAQMWGEKGTGIRGLQLSEGAPACGESWVLTDLLAALPLCEQFHRLWSEESSLHLWLSNFFSFFFSIVKTLFRRNLTQDPDI